MSLLAVVVLAAQAAAPPPAPANGPCAAVVVRSPQAASRTTRQATFSSRTALELQFRARLRYALRGEHLLRLEVRTPRGYLYQQIEVPFVGPALTASRLAASRGRALPPPPPRVLPGFPHPVETQRLTPITGNGLRLYELTARFPVAGTSITMSSLYGSWSVQPWLDEQEAPCGPATRFTIRD